MDELAIDKAREFFAICDVEKKEFIIKRDMQRLGQQLPTLNPDQLEDVFDSLDSNKSGFLTADEFVRGFAFLGLQIPDDKNANNDSEDELKMTNQTTDALKLDQFQNIMDTLGAGDVFAKYRAIINKYFAADGSSSDSVKELWQKIRKDDPDLLDNFENFIANVSSELRRSKDDFSSLEAALKRRRQSHDAQVGRLYEEMEQQIGAEKERILEQEQIKAQKFREEMEKGMLEKDQELNEIIRKHNELEEKYSSIAATKTLTERENEELQKERYEFDRQKRKMESELDQLKDHDGEAKLQLETLKTKVREEKKKRAKESLNVTQSIATEREQLVKQLDQLRKDNLEMCPEEGTEEGDFESETISDYANPKQQVDLYKTTSLITGGSLADELASVSQDEGGMDQREIPLRGNIVTQNGTPERIFKVVFVGDSGVGKTSFLHRFCHDRFVASFNATIGVDFTVKNVQLPDRLIALQLWDTAGQERFRSITKQYFRKADGVVLMYDVTSEQSFLDLRNWMISVKEGVDEMCTLCMVGNKLDLCQDDQLKVVKFDDGNQLAQEYGMLFFETSSASGYGVTECMRELAVHLYEGEEKYLDALKLEMNVQEKKKCCRRD